MARHVCSREGRASWWDQLFEETRESFLSGGRASEAEREEPSPDPHLLGPDLGLPASGMVGNKRKQPTRVFCVAAQVDLNKRRAL